MLNQEPEQLHGGNRGEGKGEKGTERSSPRRTAFLEALTGSCVVFPSMFCHLPCLPGKPDKCWGTNYHDDSGQIFKKSVFSFCQVVF